MVVVRLDVSEAYEVSGSETEGLMFPLGLDIVDAMIS